MNITSNTFCKCTATFQTHYSRPTQFLTKVKSINSKLFWICCSSSSGVLSFDWQTSLLNQPHKKKSLWVRPGTSWRPLCCSSTSNPPTKINGCQVMYKQEVQNVAVLHLTGNAFRNNLPTETDRHIIAKHIKTVAVYCSVTQHKPNQTAPYPRRW
jgi:hypothetical protein